MGQQSDIDGALIAHFSALGYDAYTSYPNGPSVDFPVTQMNYAVDILYAQPVAAGLFPQAADRHKGILQITIRVPKVKVDGNPAGLYEGFVAANTIAAAFKRGTAVGYPTAAPTQYVHMMTPGIKHFPKISETWYGLTVSAEFWADVYA